MCAERKDGDGWVLNLLLTEEGFGYCFTPTPKHIRGSWSHYTDTSEHVDDNGAQNMVNVQSGFRTRDLSIFGPTRLPTALTGPTLKKGGGWGKWHFFVCLSFCVIFPSICCTYICLCRLQLVFPVTDSDLSGLNSAGRLMSSDEVKVGMLTKRAQCKSSFYISRSFRDRLFVLNKTGLQYYGGSNKVRKAHSAWLTL
jgi:hypothetical protein